MAISPDNTISVAAFGRHRAYGGGLPADLGDPTPLAAGLRQTFYSDGILKNSGDFDALQKSGQAIPFGHWVFYRQMQQGAALARLWTSRDSGNSSEAAMILAACAGGEAGEWLMNHAPAVLASAQQRCGTASKPQELTAAVQGASEELRERADGGTEGSGRPTMPMFSGQRAALVAGLRAISDYLPLDGRRRPPSPVKTTMVRVAALGATGPAAISAWSALLESALEGRKTKYFIIVPDDAAWADLIIGEPSPAQWVCLRSNSQAIPPVMAKPDELDDVFGHRVLAWLAALSVKAASVPVAPPPPLPPVNHKAVPWGIIGAAAAIVAAVIIVAVLALRHRGGDQAAVAPAAVPLPVTAAADPRLNWNLAIIKQDALDVQQAAERARQIKQAFIDVPGVADGVSEPPSVEFISAQISDLASAQWPADKDKIVKEKNDLDAAVSRVDLTDLKGTDLPGQAWKQTLRVLRAVRFASQAIGDRWDHLVDDERLDKGYTPDPAGVPLPEIYRRLAALDQAAIAATPEMLSAELDAATSDVGLNSQTVVDDLRHRAEAAAHQKAAVALSQSALKTAQKLLDQAEPAAQDLTAVLVQLGEIGAAEVSPAVAADIKEKMAEIDAITQARSAPVASNPVAAITQAGTPALAGALWRAWVNSSPAGRPLEEDAQVAAAIKVRVGRQLNAEVTEVEHDRWIRRFDALWSTPAVVDEKAVDQVMAAARADGIVDPSAVLGGEARYDLLLHQFKERLGGNPSDREAMDAARKLLVDLRALPAGGPLAEALRKAMAPPATAAAGAGPEGRFTRTAGDADGAVVKYNCLGFKLSFVQVGDSYVCADEFPVGLFIALANQQKWKASDLGVDPGYIHNDHHLVPRCWDWQEEDDTMVLASQWVVASGGEEDLVRDIKGGADDVVNSQSPMQYVTPRAALLAAEALGCRLPTIAEWQAAAEEAHSATPRVSEADRARYLAIFQRLSVPVGLAGYLYPWVDGQPAPAARGAMPRRVWFAPVRADGDTVVDMDGNVAELACDDPHLTAAALSSEDTAKFAVMGASAWAGPAVDPTLPHSIFPDKTKPAIAPHWADVGFRLEYSGPPTPGAGVLAKAARDAAYVAVGGDATP